MASQPNSSQPQVLLKQIYIKDLSFESPLVPDGFASNIESRIDLNVRSDSRDIDAESVEVTLTVIVKSIAEDKTVFSIEIAQAGIFVFQGYTPEQRFQLLATVCPEALFAYARAAITTAASKGGFPDLLLQPLDFHGLFQQDMMARATQSLR